MATKKDFDLWNVERTGNKNKDRRYPTRSRETQTRFYCPLRNKKKGTRHAELRKIHTYIQRSQNGSTCKKWSIDLHPKKHKKNITSWEAVSDRMIKINMNLKGSKTTIIATYGPNENAQVEEKERYYETPLVIFDD